MPANDGDTYTQIASRRPLSGSKLPLEDGIALDGAFPALGFRAAEPLWRRVRDEVDERRNLHRFASPGELRRKPGLPARAVQREPPLPRAFVHRSEPKRFPSFDGSGGPLPGPSSRFDERRFRAPFAPPSDRFVPVSCDEGSNLKNILPKRDESEHDHAPCIPAGHSKQRWRVFSNDGFMGRWLEFDQAPVRVTKSISPIVAPPSTFQYLHDAIMERCG